MVHIENRAYDHVIILLKKVGERHKYSGLYAFENKEKIVKIHSMQMSPKFIT
jgi:hypothetical protein